VVLFGGVVPANIRQLFGADERCMHRGAMLEISRG